jgi:hypothetical protein
MGSGKPLAEILACTGQLKLTSRPWCGWNSASRFSGRYYYACAGVGERVPALIRSYFLRRWDKIVVFGDDHDVDVVETLK